MDRKLALVIQSLQKTQDARHEQDIRQIHSHFSQQLWFQELQNNEIEDLCLRGRYEKHNIGSVIYRKGDVVKSWYVLMTGNVIIGTLLFSSPACFGQNRNTLRRIDDCLVLDPSEVVVIDYHCPEDQCDSKPRLLNKSLSFSGDGCHANQANKRYLSQQVSDDKSQLKSMRTHVDVGDKNEIEEFSREIDSLSSFSAQGSDTITSSLGDHGVDLTGLLESTVDSDDDNSDDDVEMHIKKKTVSDAVLEALEKETKTEKDIKLIVDLIQHLHAFNNMTSNVRKSLCSVMRFAQIEEANKILISEGAQLDTWVVILNGLVEIEEPDKLKFLQTGDCFGVKPSTANQLNNQIIKTKSEKCQFLLVPQEDYCRILNEGEENILKVYEDGEVVLVYERRKVGDKEVKVVIRGEPNHLLQEIFQEGQDPFYVQDFLLMYRTFFKYPSQVAYKIVEYLENPIHKEKVVPIFLNWMNWHYRDFDNNMEMRIFLEHLEKRLQDLGMLNELDLLTSTCAKLSKPRVIVLTKKSKDESLQFEIVGDNNNNKASSIFVSRVEEGSKAHDAGLGRGDQILEVNAKSFKNISVHDANAFLSGATHLSITVKYNMHEYKQLRKKANKQNNEMQITNSHIPKNGRQSKACLPFNLEDPGKPPVFGKIRNKLLKIFPINALGQLSSSNELLDPGKHHTLGSGKRFGSSHPDLSSLHLSQNNKMVSDFVNDLNVLKIYKEDQSYRYVFVDKEITAQQVVMLALKEFGLLQTSRDFALYEVTFHSDNCIKQKRLPDNLHNLAEILTFHSRYYIKHIEGTNSLLSDDCLDEFKKECRINFLSLNCAELAAQLTCKDFELFSKISPSEYVENIFQLDDNVKKSKSNSDPMSSLSNLKQFEKLIEMEMFWVATHICSEQNLSNRVKSIKHFIQIARHCIECKNFNSAFTIISGLGHWSVSRLKQTWEKLPSKSQKHFEDIQNLMDPSHNMSKYRSIANAGRPPLIPFYPLVSKDLQFIQIGNDSIIDGLINFDKLRMIAKMVRQITNMATSLHATNFSSLNNSAMAMRRKIDDLSILNRKKMFEDAQMVRKVRAYLTSYKLVEDENQLTEMSDCCEPSDGTTKRFDMLFGASKITPSNCSAPKFGTDSPENIKKLVSLSAGSRPFERSSDELVMPVNLDDQRLKKLHKTQNSFKNSQTNLLSNSQFYFPINLVQAGPESNFHKRKPRNLSKETDSGRYSGDDGSIGSINSNHGSPPMSNISCKKEITANGKLPPSSSFQLSKNSKFDNFTLGNSSGLVVTRHSADHSRSKNHIKKSTTEYSIGDKRDYV